MNRKLIAVTTASLALVMPLLSLAVTGIGTGGTSEPNVGFSGNISSILGNITNLVWLVFVTIAIIMFVVAGILFLTAQGDSEKLSTARNAALWGVIGVAVAIIGYAIIYLVRTQLGA